VQKKQDTRTCWSSHTPQTIQQRASTVTAEGVHSSLHGAAPKCWHHPRLGHGKIRQQVGAAPQPWQAQAFFNATTSADTTPNWEAEKICGGSTAPHPGGQHWQPHPGRRRRVHSRPTTGGAPRPQPWQLSRNLHLHQQPAHTSTSPQPEGSTPCWRYCHWVPSYISSLPRE
jgi:hypothetical protein